MRHLIDHLSDGAKTALDAISITALVGSIVSMFPAVASLLTIIWTAIRIYETDTVQRWVAGRALPKDRPDAE
ncbi:hypothetical protein GTZ99_03130 [Novosphingobium sp. FSY-8]|uniref:Uncharacterized protein n=1 Tax=Novosphingobium ovatum TaxID=1908523 RepID=A0ABW9XAI7_9SPHN|nr:hypothetical protein [Novosphingobium ovatum]NBC35545.1 hypothetical protein [Novosphingobium ovatum]